MRSALGSFLATASFVFSISATAQVPSAQTVLHVPLFVEITSGVQPKPVYDYVPVSEMNKIFLAKGIEPQQEFVALTVSTKFDAGAAQTKLDEAIQAAGLKNTQAFGEYVPANYAKGSEFTCYRGDGAGVVDIVLANTDNLYSDQYSLFGWKLGEKTTYVDSFDSSDKDALEFINSESKAWKFYSKKSDAVVMVASIGDGGDDVQTSYIRRCK